MRHGKREKEREKKGRILKRKETEGKWNRYEGKREKDEEERT